MTFKDSSDGVWLVCFQVAAIIGAEADANASSTVHRPIDPQIHRSSTDGAKVHRAMLTSGGAVRSFLEFHLDVLQFLFG